MAIAPHWVFANTNIKAGDHFAGLLGYEADWVFDNGKTPPGLQILATSPVPVTSIDDGQQYPYSKHFNPAAPNAHMTLYTKLCTAKLCKNPVSMVFATGSMQWVWGLNSFAKPSHYENPTAIQITRNILARMIGKPLPKLSPLTNVLARSLNNQTRDNDDRFAQLNQNRLHLEKNFLQATKNK